MRRKPTADGPLWVYFVLCANGAIYVGTAIDPLRRYQRHQEGRGALFTRLNPPVCLMGAFRHPTRIAALRMERAIKRAPASLRRSMAMLATTSVAWQELKSENPT